MIYHRPSCFMVSVLIAGQILGPAGLWAAEQRGIRLETNRTMLVSAIDGEHLTLQGADGGKLLRFRDAVNVGEPVTTAEDTVAEILVGNRAVVRLAPRTSAEFSTITDEQTIVHVSQGSLRVAAAPSGIGEGGLVTIQTPSGHVQTRGGIVLVQVQGGSSAGGEHLNYSQARPQLVSYSPSQLVAVNEGQSGLIHVEEGLAEILGAGPDGTALAVPAGTSVKLQSGRVETAAGLLAQDSRQAKLLASAAHNNTPKEGVENLVALQINQATALGKALTGAPETGTGGSGNKDESKNAINGATGGVALANSGLVTQLFGSTFGTGNASSISSAPPQDQTGASFGGNNNSGFGTAQPGNTNVKLNGGDALLVFTRKDPVQSYVKEDITISLPFNQSPTYQKDALCGQFCLNDHRNSNNLQNVVFRPLQSVTSQFTVAKELVLVGGSPNSGHGGIAPTETLVVRGGAPTPNSTSFTNLASTNGCCFAPNGLFPTDRLPADVGLVFPPPTEIVNANSTFVVQSVSERRSSPAYFGGAALVGGTLGQYSNLSDPSPDGIAIDNLGGGVSHVDGAITATGSNVTLKGGVSLDRGTIATIGTTEATNNYFAAVNSSDAKYSGSVLSVINGPNGPTSLTINNRLLGVYDGSRIQMEGDDKALLAVLDARLKGPAVVPLIDIDAAFLEDGVTQGARPEVTVTSAIVTRSTIPLDGALLEASTPLLALTNATMTTTSHFADLAGNRNQSLVLGDALVALRAASLTVNGNLLNLNAASATVGYLFSLSGSSTLTINGGTLFNLANGSTLNLNANAFGVFGSGTNTLSVSNNLCASTCGLLVNSANQPFLINGSTQLKVAGVTQNVVLPNNFNVFAVAANASTPTVKITANDALFKVDSTSTLKIGNTTVVTK